MKPIYQHMGRLLLLSLCWSVTAWNTAQGQTVDGAFDDPNEVVLMETGGETLAIVSTFDWFVGNPWQLSNAAGTSANGTLYLGDYAAGNINGTDFDRLYVFGGFFKDNGTTQNFATPIAFGAYTTTKQVGSFTATNLNSGEVYASQVKLDWSAVADADGYLLFRSDQQTDYPLAVLEGEQLTSYSDIGLEVYTEYTYTIIPYRLQGNYRWLGLPSTTTGHTEAIQFAAYTADEASVSFDYSFDNHLLLNLEQQAAYIEIEDLTTGTQMYGDEYTLTEIADDALLFDNSWYTTGNSTAGGYATHNAGALETWSLEFWVNPENTSNHHVLFDDGNVSAMITQYNLIRVDVGGVTYGSDASGLSWNTWNHLAFSYDGTNLVAYSNGEVLPLGKSWGTKVETNAVANADLDSDVVFGQLQTSGTSEDGNLNAAVGLIRLWNKARTSHQIGEDFDDVFSTAVSGLVGQWTFDEERVTLTDALTGSMLSLGTTNESTYPVAWKNAVDFTEADAMSTVRAWTEAPLDAETRNYQISIYESGTGRLISRTSQEVSFTHPGAPTVAATTQTTNPYAVTVTVTAASRVAEKYRIDRLQDNVATTLGYVTPELNDDGHYQGEQMIWEDAFAYGNDASIVAGTEYSYTATPIYTQLARSYRDTDHSGTSNTITTLDFMSTLAANATQTAITLSWDNDLLEASGYEFVRIERDGEVLGTYQDLDTYTDSLVLYGQEYAYTAVALTGDAEALSAHGTASLQANGSLVATMIAAEGDFVLPYRDYTLTNESTGDSQALSADFAGAIALTGLDYGAESSYLLEAIAGAALTGANFTLAWGDWDANLGYVAYDTSLTPEADTMALHNLQVNDSVLANALVFTWDSSPVNAGGTQFVNVYRDGVLVDVVTDTLSYTDYTTDAGSHAYTFKAYYYNADYSVLYSDDEASVHGDMPALTTPASFAVTETASGIISIDWSYDPAAMVNGFTVTRTNAEGTSYEVGTVGQNGSAYTLMDSLGYPGKDYTYTLVAETIGDSEVTVASAAKTYPSLASADVILTEDSGVGVGFYGYPIVDVMTDLTVYEYPSWDGVGMINSAGQLIPLDKYEAESEDEMRWWVLMKDPAVATESGSLGMVVYKHTDEGLYVSDTLWGTYSGATVSNPEVITATAPSLEANDADIYVPTLSASTDARDRIFVNWEYPNFTDVTFDLSYRELESATWTTITLPNEQRAWMHESPSAMAMEYKLSATYADGRQSAEVWTYGVAKQYLQIAGYVYDDYGQPEPNVYVGIEGLWTLTDSAGYYRLSDLNLEPGNYEVSFMEPGFIDLQADLTITQDQQFYALDYHGVVTNTLFGPQSGTAEVFDLVAVADKVNMTNELRWMMTSTVYSGVKVYKSNASNEVADLTQGSDLVYVDSLEENNPTAELYFVRPYLKLPTGELEFHDAGMATIDGLDFPALLAPQYANTFANQAQGYVELVWAHVRNNVDGYAIYRNGELLGEVSAEDEALFIDDTGVPSQVYRYDIYAFLDREVGKIYAQNSISVDATFPTPGDVTDVQTAQTTIAATGTDDNSIDISWTYPSEGTVDGTVLYRGLDSVASVAYPTASMVDSLGTPESYQRYTLRTYVEIDGLKYYSSGIDFSDAFPIIQSPEFTVANPHFDSLLVNWDYPAVGVGAFELEIVETASGTAVVSEEIAHTGAAQQYHFEEGISGLNYTVSLRAISERRGETYASDWIDETISHSTLPTPATTVAYVTGELQATLNWSLSTERHEGYTLTITDNNGTVTQLDDEGNTVNYGNMELGATQASYTFIADFDDLLVDNDNTITYNFGLTVHQDEAGGIPVSVTESVNIELVGGSYYPQTFEASTGGRNSVALSWSAPQNVSNLDHYVIYRDGYKVATLAATDLSYSDDNADPGIPHTYELAAVHNGNAYRRTAQGSIKGDGLITLEILTESGTPMEGDSIQISAAINGTAYSSVGYSDENGRIQFGELAYQSDGITYRLKALGNADHYDPASASLTLTNSASQGSAGVFYYTHVREIQGTIANTYCTDCGRDSVEVSLYSVDVEGTTTLESLVKTDEQGAFAFAIPYQLTNYREFYLEVPNASIGELGENMYPYTYDYEESTGDMSVNTADSTLTVTFDAYNLGLKENHEVNIYDQISYPLEVQITGPGDCDVLAGYEFTLRVRDVNGKYDAFHETTNRVLSTTLPPYDFIISVVSVNRVDAFSQAVVDYFRARSLSVDNATNYADWYASGETDQPVTTQLLRYSERATLSINNLDAIEADDCGVYVMEVDESVSLAIQPSQTINTITCGVTSGYMLARFGGGIVTDNDNDTLEYVDGAWETALVTATTPNVVSPYTQLLEFYYYDAGGNYQGSTSEEIIVTGKRGSDDQDVFVIIDEAVPVPLYVLRDPPGDNSHAYIQDGSSMQFTLKNEDMSSVGFGAGLESELSVLGITGSASLTAEGSAETTSGESQVYSLNFGQGLTTAAEATASANLQGYLDGKDADIVVGMDIILAYGLTEVLSFEDCAADKDYVITVNPNEISTAWAYTRSQIETTVNYYDRITAENSNYEFEVEGGGDATEIVAAILKSREAFATILNDLDSKYTPLCEMCLYAQDFDEKDVTLFMRNTYESYREDVLTFCSASAEYDESAGACSDTQVDDLVIDWDEDTRDAYRTAYRKYLAMREAARFNAGYKAGIFSEMAFESEILSALQSFDPLENLTFSAGANVSRALDQTATGTNLDAVKSIASLEVEYGVGYETEFNVDAWFGFGGGTDVGNGAEASYSINATVSVKSDSEYLTEYESESGVTFETGFELNDDDDGDQFSVDVLHSAAMAETRISPYFSLVGGRSSCPYEIGTLPRDVPTLQLMSTDEALWPTAYYDLDPEATLRIPVAIHSGNNFGESRLVDLTAPLGSNRFGLGLTVENEGISAGGGATFLVEPDTSYYTYLYVDRDGLSEYDFADVELLVKPSCSAGDYWEDARVYDTTGLEFYYHKPISPITLETAREDWFATQAHGQVTFRLTDYDVAQVYHNFKEVVMEYKKANDTTWNVMVNHTTGLELVAADYLLDYYNQKFNVYPDPVYPFVWALPHNLADGTYQVRATMVHEGGSFAYSNALTGTVDTRQPHVLSWPEPTDSLFSQGDVMSITFDEDLNKTGFMAEPENVTVTVLDDDGADLETLSGTLDYAVAHDGSTITITVDRDVLLDYDGYKWEIALNNVADYLGNPSAGENYNTDEVAVDGKHVWTFYMDYYKTSPSPVTLVGPDAWTRNIADGDNGNMTLDFAVTDYDVFQGSYSLSALALQVKRDADANWMTVDTKTQAELAATQRSRADNLMAATDTLSWDASSALDGVYDIRVISNGSTGQQFISNGVTGTIDRLAPEVLGAMQPADGVYHAGDEIRIDFSEIMDCNAGFQYNSTVTPYGGTAEPLTPTQAICEDDTESQLVFSYDEAELLNHFGGTITLEINAPTDLAGNPLVGGTLYHSFTIGQWGGETSPVSILDPAGDWMINGANSSVTFTLGDYDVYEVETTLEALTLEVRASHQTDWTVIDSVSQADLVAYDQANRTEAEAAPSYPITWTPSGLGEGQYSVRAVAYGEFGFPEYSQELHGMLDVSAPWLLSVTPADDTVRTAEPIVFTFSETMASASLADSQFEFSEVVITENPANPFGYDTTLVKMATANYRAELEGSTLTIHLDEDFVNTNDGALIDLAWGGITDALGNEVVDSAYHNTLVVRYDAAAASRMGTLDLAGAQQEDGTIALTWNHYDQEGTQAYLLERSLDGQTFELVTGLSARNVDQYTHTDEVRFDDHIFYRLRVQRTDGTEVYSRIATIVDAGFNQRLSLEVYPNPIEDRKVAFTWYSQDTDAPLTIEIRDLAGRMLYQQSLDGATRNQQQHVKLPDHLESGLYVLHLSQGSATQSIKFVNP